MGQKPKCKMSNLERAKQFMPFAALKGFEEAIAKQERINDAKYDKQELNNNKKTDK